MLGVHCVKFACHPVLLLAFPASILPGTDSDAILVLPLGAVVQDAVKSIFQLPSCISQVQSIPNRRHTQNECRCP